jgi:hypothetical protein
MSNIDAQQLQRSLDMASVQVEQLQADLAAALIEVDRLNVTAQPTISSIDKSKLKDILCHMLQSILDGKCKISKEIVRDLRKLAA